MLQSVRAALAEDGLDLTSRAVFAPEQRGAAVISAKAPSLVAGLPLIPLILAEAAKDEAAPALPWSWEALAAEGKAVNKGDELARLRGSARLLLKAERVILNFLTHLSGIAQVTSTYAARLSGTKSRLLDTRKTLPGLRYPEKYAVLAGGGSNHRLNLEELLMIKDNHVDAAGSISRAVALARAACSPCPPVEVECRDAAETLEAVRAGADRIMLDNMDLAGMAQALALIPPRIETEVSGGVSLDNIRAIADLSPRGPDFISVGRLTHSAPAADFSLRFLKAEGA